MATTFRGVIEFFNQLGIYDVILPFLLVFSIVFAILEKTKVLGYEDAEKKLTKKNLNSMVAFVIAFLVVGSTKLVSIVNETMANIVLLILLAVSFLMLVGVFLGTEETKFKWDDPWMIFFSFFMFIAIVAIFLHAIKTDSGQTWLDYIFSYISSNWSGNTVGTIILAIVVVGFMWFVTKSPKKEEKKG